MSVPDTSFTVNVKVNVKRADTKAAGINKNQILLLFLTVVLKIAAKPKKVTCFSQVLDSFYLFLVSS